MLADRAPVSSALLDRSSLASSDDPERGDVPGWGAVPLHGRRRAAEPVPPEPAIDTLDPTSPKVRLHGTDVPGPQPGGGGSPFEPGRGPRSSGHCGNPSSRPHMWGNAWQRTADGARELAADESGDVPGWVLITLMTAGLVVLIWAVAGPALTNLFEQAIARVSGL